MRQQTTTREENQRTTQVECLQLLLKPLVNYCLRNAHSFHDLINIARVVFVRSAEEEIKKTSSKINVSRISALTGIHRDDVARIFREKEIDFGEPLSVLGRVLGQWEQDKRFVTKAGKPRLLTFQGDNSEFRELVFSVSKHLNPGTILFELERAGAVRKENQRLRRVTQLPPAGVDPRKGYDLVQKDITTLLEAADENIRYPDSIPNLHIRTEYDNIYVDDLPKIRLWLIDEGKAFHRRLRDFLSQSDKDLGPYRGEEAKAGAKVNITTTSLTTRVAEVVATEE